MAAVHGSSAPTSMEVPQTQNTAPVLEFRCLYTQDLRRKQKRWQDGRLKFHTFNKRVMVYDDRSNFVGDTHWREDSELDDGDELELERGGYLVQVQDFIGKKDQDLSELVDKRLKEKEERAAAKSAASPAAERSQGFGTPAPHLKPKALNTLLTPSGHYGRAVISTTSPFEDRQQLVNGDGNENDRPAKRRKTVESTQSKNGYAQNLMGASLTLTSSKPPGTASIRYEPFKTKPSVPQVPTKTIDLTLDDDDDAEASESMHSGKRMTQKAKRYRSPPPKSTYASNLTGTALSLSRPEPSKYVSKKPAIKTTSEVLQDADEFSAEEEDSFPDIDSFPASVSKAREPATKKAKPKPTVISSSSSPPPIERRKKLKAVREERINHSRSGSSSPVLEATAKKSKAVPSIAREETNNRSSSPMTDHAPSRRQSALSIARTASKNVERDTAEQPVSALRIKAKPRRQMMMLMERPSSRTSLRGDYTPKSRTAPKTTSRQMKSSNEIVLSQATVQLNAFCEKQEQRLQARLNGQRPRISLDSDDLEELDSSPLDSGINHQAIDDLLTRKPVAEASAVASTSTRLKAIHMVDKGPERKEVAKTVVSDIPDEFGMIDEEQSIPDVDLPDIPSDKSVPDDLNSKVDRKARQASPKSPIQVEPAVDSPVKPRSPKPVNPVCKSERVVLTVDTNEPTVETTSTEVAAAEALPVEPLIEKEKSLPENSPENKPRPHGPPKYVNAALEPTIEHFRAIVKSSPASPPQVNETAPRPQDTVVEEVERPMNEASPLEKPEPASSELNLKQSPKPSPIEQISPVEQPSLVEQVLPVEQAEQAVPIKQSLPTELRNTINSNFRTAQNLHTRLNPLAPPPRPKLLNPATRGKSLHKTVAESNEAMALALKTNPMPPPPAPAPQIPSLLSRADSGRIAGAGECGAPKSRYPATGPWSRESFDLFGNWRPPGRGISS